MTDRKPPSRNSPQSAHGVAAKTRGRAVAHGALPGDSETEFTDEELERIVAEAWQHGRAMPPIDDSIWRQDACGAWMMREHFGHADSEFGWKIEKVAVENADRGGLLRPFNWRNHFDIANGRPHCDITADRAGVPAGRQASPPRNKQA